LNSTVIVFVAAIVAGCSPPSVAAGPMQDASPSGTSPAEAVIDRAMLGGREVLLVTRDKACILRQSGKPDATLAPAAPCRFLRHKGQVLRHSYPARKVDEVVMVGGSPASIERKRYFNASADSECGDVAQGLLVRGTTVEPSRYALRGGLVCNNVGLDEKDFYAVAHEYDTGPGTP
jgi:hypothetical protein